MSSGTVIVDLFVTPISHLHKRICTYYTEEITQSLLPGADTFVEFRDTKAHGRPPETTARVINTGKVHTSSMNALVSRPYAQAGKWLHILPSENPYRYMVLFTSPVWPSHGARGSIRDELGQIVPNAIVAFVQGDFEMQESSGSHEFQEACKMMLSRLTE